MSTRVNSYAHNIYEDLSGASTPKSDNPYDGLITGSNHDPKQIQARYDTHRETRNAQQKAKMLAPDFAGISIDPVLARLEDPTIEPGFKDPRYCMTFWARPPKKIRDLVGVVQTKLREVAPHLWLMPSDCLHMTTIEITHSRTEETIAQIVQTMSPSIPHIVDYSYDHRARLIKPMVSYDAAACALSFVPAAGEAPPAGRAAEDDTYTYHHLRRDVFKLCSEAGIEVDSRYVVPSAHLTIGRFIDVRDFEKEDGKQDMSGIIKAIEDVNEWLKSEYWPKGEEGERIKDGGEWVVGEEKGFDCRTGTLWYGGGKTVKLGKGF